MNIIRSATFSVLVILTALDAASAQPTIVDVPLNEPAVITLTGSGAVHFAQPLHGTLTLVDGTLHYTPSTSFWEVGFDRISYTRGINPGVVPPTHVYLSAFDQPIVSVSANFDDGMLEKPPHIVVHGDIGRMSTDPNAAMGGTHGVIITPGPNNLFLRLDSNPGGEPNHGGGGEGGVEPPWPPSGQMGDAGLRLMSFGGGEVEVRLKSDDDQYFIMARHISDPSPDHPSTVWYPFGKDIMRRVQVLLLASAVENPPTTTVSASYQLRVDGKVASQSPTFTTDQWPGVVVDIGPQDFPPEGASGTGMLLDEVASYEPMYGRGADLLSADDFDNGFPVSWTLSSPNALFFEPPSSGEGFLLSAPADGVGFARDATPASASGIGVRFVLFPDDAALASGGRIAVLALASSDTGGSDHVRLWLSHDGGYRVQLEAFDDLGASRLTAPVPLAAGGQVVEVMWQRALGPVNATGHATLRFDGTQVARLEALDTDTQTIESIALGSVLVEGTTSGTLSFDDFMLWER